MIGKARLWPLNRTLSIGFLAARSTFELQSQKLSATNASPEFSAALGFRHESGRGSIFPFVALKEGDDISDSPVVHF